MALYVRSDGPFARPHTNVFQFAGMVGKVLEYPFDTVKVRLQTQPQTVPLRYNGPVDCFMQGLRADGMRGLYRGISSPLVGAAAENSCLFFSVRPAPRSCHRRPSH